MNISETLSVEIPKKRAEISRFFLETRLEDIITKSSVFNPYPERAAEGIEVLDPQFYYYTDVNPTPIIKYPATGEVFVTELPIFTEQAFIKYPIFPPLTQSSGAWRPVEHAWALTCLSLIQKTGDKKDTSFLLEQAIAPTDDEEGEPILEHPKDVYTNLITTAKQCIQEGDWKSGINLVEKGFRFEECIIRGTSTSSKWIGFRDYRDRYVAIDYFPGVGSLYPTFTLPMNIAEKDRATHPQVVSQDLTDLVKKRIKELALQKALEEETDPVVRGNYHLVINYLQTSIQELLEKFRLLKASLGEGSLQSPYVISALE